MGASESRFVVRELSSDFGGKVDRNKLHDVPWIQTLKEIGEIDEKALEQFVTEATDLELHCCRSFFRAYKDYLREAPEGDDRDFSNGLYFTVAQSPSHLLILYSIFHHCWLLDLEVLDLPEDMLGVGLVHSGIANYMESKGPSPDEMDEDIDVDEIYDSMSGIVASYLESVLEVVSNPHLLDSEVSAFGKIDNVDEEIQAFTLRASDASIVVKVCELGARMVECNMRGRKMMESIETPEQLQKYSNPGDGKIWRAAREPQNSSLSNQVFYYEAEGEKVRGRVEYRVDDDAKLTILENIEFAEQPFGLSSVAWSFGKEEELTVCIGKEEKIKGKELKWTKDKDRCVVTIRNPNKEEWRIESSASQCCCRVEEGSKMQLTFQGEIEAAKQYGCHSDFQMLAKQ